MYLLVGVSTITFHCCCHWCHLYCLLSQWPIFCHQSLEFKMIKAIVILIITSPKLIAPTVLITMSRTSRPTLPPLPPPLLSSSSSSSSSSSLHYSTMYITITIIIIIIVIIAIINTIIIIILTNWQQFHIEITSHCSKLRCGSWFHWTFWTFWRHFYGR